MKKSMFSVFIFCLTFSQIKSDQEINKGIILNQMKEWGNKIFSSGFYITGTVKNQYLVAAVVTNSMLEDPKLLQLTRSCPITKPQIFEQVFSDTSMICAFSAVVFNRVDEEIWKRSEWKNNTAYKYHSWHGEYIFLREGIFKILTKQFKAIGSNEPCQTFLYSYFIPCNYNSQIQPYRCLKELLDYDQSNDKCPITVIGYTSAHPATAKNLEETKNALREKHDLVQLVKIKTNKTDKNAFEISEQVIKYAHIQTTPFQDVFYKCLSNCPIEFCCIDVTRNNNTKDQVLALYVNNVTENFVTTGRFKSFSGAISSNISNRTNAEFKFLSLATKQLSNGCNRCSIKHVKLYVSYCTKNAFDMADYFGIPCYNPAHPGWKKYEDIWLNMYINVNGETYNTAKCKRDLLPEAMCTAKTPNIPNLLRKRQYNSPSARKRASGS